MSYAFKQCKKFENRLGFDKVTESLKAETFLRHSVSVIQQEIYPIGSQEKPTLRPQKNSLTLGHCPWLHWGRL